VDGLTDDEDGFAPFAADFLPEHRFRDLQSMLTAGANNMNRHESISGQARGVGTARLEARRDDTGAEPGMQLPRRRFCDKCM
jgi:hypothetical protein